MDVSNSNISNLFACLSNINDKFENKIVKVQETVSHQIENFDSIIDSKINDNNQIINKSISDINDLLNFGSNTSKVYSKDEVNENFLDKSAAENKFNDFNTKINTTVYSKEDTNKLLAQKLNSEIINNYFDKPTIENKATDVGETPEKEENLSQEKETEKEEYVGEEEKVAEQENVASQTQSKDEKAIELAKKEWGDDDSVTFNIEEKDGDKYYVAVKKDATAIKWYEVDTDKWTVSEY